MVSEETKSKRLKEEECIISCLPHELIERIFFRLPATTLLKCSGVCKQWYKLIRDPHFIEAHLEQGPRSALLFFAQESVSGKHYPSDAIVFDEVWSQSTMAVPVIGPDDFLCGTCNGLLCLYTKTSKIKIANLATGECLLLDKPKQNLKGDHFSYYRFGFHPITKEYKVIHFLSERNNVQGIFNIIQVYTLGSEKWRDIRASEALSLRCLKDYGVVSVDGVMFWLTADSFGIWKPALVSFDLSEETFTRIQLPAPAPVSSKTCRYWITEIDGKLCIATSEDNRYPPRMPSCELKIWMLDSKVEQRWRQIYNLPYERNYLPGPHFIHSDKILMQNHNCDLYSYELFGKNHETKSSDRVKLLDFSPRKPRNMQSYICVTSLVRLDAYMKVSIVHGTKQREGWELKKWQAWKREIHEVEDAWRNIYEMEQNSSALPRHLGIVAKEVLQRLPDELARGQVTAEVDQILQHLPDCPVQHPRPLWRLNWVERKWDTKKLSACIDGVKDMAKASNQAQVDILKVLSNVWVDHLQKPQEEVNWILHRTRLEMHAAVQGECSPKRPNGASMAQLKSSVDGTQNCGPSKGKQRERAEQGNDPAKQDRDRTVQDDEREPGNLKMENMKSEIANITEKGGLPHADAVEKLIHLMQLDRIERKIDFAGRVMVADIIAATESPDCLVRFVQLRGLPVLDDWLQEVKKSKSGEGSSPKETDEPLEEFIFALLRALAKLPINLNALQNCSIGKSVNHLRSHKNLEIQKKAKCLIVNWKKRIDAEMKSNDVKAAVSGQASPWPEKAGFSEISNAGNKRSGSSEPSMKIQGSQISSSKDLTAKYVAGDAVAKSAPPISRSSKSQHMQPANEGGSECENIKKLKVMGKQEKTYACLVAKGEQHQMATEPSPTSKTSESSAPNTNHEKEHTNKCSSLAASAYSQGEHKNACTTHEKLENGCSTSPDATLDGTCSAMVTYDVSELLQAEESSLSAGK